MKKRNESIHLIRAMFLLSVALTYLITLAHADKLNEYAEMEDNDFAEFDNDEFENVDENRVDSSKKEKEEDDWEDDSVKVEEEEEEPEEEETIVEDENGDFSHFEDEDEFIGYKTEDSESDSNKRKKKTPPGPPPNTINIAKIPAHLSTNWDSYYLEILMIIGIFVYFVNFFHGKSKNQNLANLWLNAHKSLLESNFSLVGDDGKQDKDQIESPFIKESENTFTLWCSGRLCCEGMLVELKFLKRQDLVSIISYMMKPAYDQIHIKVNMNPEEMDSIIFCVSQKKTAAKMSKELNDLATYCPDKKFGERFGIPDKFMVHAEFNEIAQAILDSKMTTALNRYTEYIDSIHMSDQFTGPKPTEEQLPNKLPRPMKVLMFTFNIPTRGKKLETAIEDLKPLMPLVFYCMDKVRKYKLSRDVKAKADKNRSKVAEVFWKSIHSARAEEAQVEKERKRRERKEKILETDDPEKQRKLEEKELKRDKKKNAPRVKQLRVKAI